MNKVLNFGELQAYIKSALTVELEQEEKIIKVKLLLNKKDFFETELEIDIEPFKDDIKEIANEAIAEDKAASAEDSEE